MKDNTLVVRIEPRPRGKPRRDKDGLHKRRGIWHYKLKIDGRWQELSTKTKDYREAKRIRQQALQAQEEGRLPSDAARMKLSQAIPPWLKERKRLRSSNTWKVERHLVKPILKALGEKRLCDITSDDLHAYQLKRIEEVSAKTVDREMRIVRAVLHQRKLWGRLADDYQPVPEQSRGPGRALTDEEERRLFDKAGSRPGWQAAYYASLLAANTTARGCELRGLRLEDVDLIEGVVRIQRRSTKTDAGCRVIPLNGTVGGCATAGTGAGSGCEQARALSFPSMSEPLHRPYSPPDHLADGLA